MTVVEFVTPKRRRKIVRFETTTELIRGFFCDTCQLWSPNAEHRCLVGLRKPR